MILQNSFRRTPLDVHHTAALSRVYTVTLHPYKFGTLVKTCIEKRPTSRLQFVCSGRTCPVKKRAYGYVYIIE